MAPAKKTTTKKTTTKKECPKAKMMSLQRAQKSVKKSIDDAIKTLKKILGRK